MKKKLLALIMVLSLIFAATTVGCSSSSADSSSDASTTETEAPEDTEDASGEEKAVDETEEESTDASEEKETSGSGEVLTGDTEITDEDVQEVYASIKESIETRYLEPNNISPEEFSWPEEESEGWDYLHELLAVDIPVSIALGDNNIPEENIEKYDNQYSFSDKELFVSIVRGVFDWIDSIGELDIGDSGYSYFTRLYLELDPLSETLPTNITFE